MCVVAHPNIDLSRLRQLRTIDIGAWVVVLGSLTDPSLCAVLWLCCRVWIACTRDHVCGDVLGIDRRCCAGWRWTTVKLDSVAAASDLGKQNVRLHTSHHQVVSFKAATSHRRRSVRGGAWFAR